MWVSFLTPPNRISSRNKLLQLLLVHKTSLSDFFFLYILCWMDGWMDGRAFAAGASCGQGKAADHVSRFATHLWASVGGSGHAVQEVEEECLVSSLETVAGEGEWSKNRWATGFWGKSTSTCRKQFWPCRLESKTSNSKVLFVPYCLAGIVSKTCSKCWGWLIHLVKGQFIQNWMSTHLLLPRRRWRLW